MTKQLADIHWSYKLILGILILLLLSIFVFRAFNFSSGEVYAVTICEPTIADSIFINHDEFVRPILYTKIPDLSLLSIEDRKERFIQLMLPSVLLASEKMKNEQLRVKRLKVKIESGIAIGKDSLIMDSLLHKYKTTNVNRLIANLNPHPLSITLAQAAIESGWGTSRFFREANNVYGVWSYNSTDRRIKAYEGRNGKSIYLKKYDSLFESVYDYLLTLSKAPAYKKFREARCETTDPFRLIWHLKSYSELRTQYIETLRNVIEYNDLVKYDVYKLARIKEDDYYWNSMGVAN